MNLNSLQDLDSKLLKDADLKELDVRRFRSNIISEPHSWDIYS
jgi:hypothetical protein